MKTTLLAGICIILAGVVVGLVFPEGSLLAAMRGMFGLAPQEVASQAVEPVSSAAVDVAPAVSEVREKETPADATALDVGYAPAQPGAVASSTESSTGGECLVLTEAAREGYLSAGYATQEFATTSIMAAQDKTSQAAVTAARDRYETALKTAHDQVAAASRAQCWSRTGAEPPNLAAFESSLPKAALQALER